MDANRNAVSRDERVEFMARRLQAVEERIQSACARAGRRRSAMTLVAVSKTRSLEEIEAGYICGLRNLGENRVEEMELKVPRLAEQHAADPIIWHMIGHIQSRKARDAVLYSNMIQSVDSLSLMRRLDRVAGEMGKKLPVLLELNVSGEPSKYGFPAHDAATLERTLGELANEAGVLKNLNIRGLMTMAPIVAEMEMARPVFARLREVQGVFRTYLTFSEWTELSMGMTDDFDVAIEEGATIVRIGRALFGAAIYGENK